MSSNNSNHAFIKGDVWSNVQILGIGLFVATLCFRQDVSHIILICTLFVSLFRIRLNLLKKNWFPILVVSQLYLIAIFSTFYSTDKAEAYFVLEKQMTFILLPIMFGASKQFRSAEIRFILLSFVVFVTLACIFLLFEFYKDYQLLEVKTDFGLFLNSHLHHSFSDPLRLHATFLSMYVCFSIAITSYGILRGAGWLRLVAVLILPILVISMVLLSSRIILIPFVIIMIFILPFFVNGLPRVIYFLLLIILGVFGFRYLGSFSAIRDRLKDDTLRELNLTADSTQFLAFDTIRTNDATRAERWNCAIELIHERPYLGYGTGDEKKMLKEKYIKYGLTNSITNNFDAHNQYLAFGIKSGYLGVLSFIFCLLYFLIIGIKRSDFFFLSFLVIISVTSLTENVLESNKGILFFAIFSSLFLFRINDQQESPF